MAAQRTTHEYAEPHGNKNHVPPARRHLGRVIFDGIICRRDKPRAFVRGCDRFLCPCRHSLSRAGLKSREGAGDKRREARKPSGCDIELFFLE